MKWPGHIEQGTISDHATKTEDIYAIIVDIARPEAKTGQPLDGRSLVSDFNSDRNLKNSFQKNMFWYFLHYITNQPGSVIKSEGYKFIQFFDPYHAELYNLAKDPEETNDLSDSAGFRWKLKELQGKLREWFHDVDPIMHTMNPRL